MQYESVFLGCVTEEGCDLQLSHTGCGHKGCCESCEDVRLHPGGVQRALHNQPPQTAPARENPGEPTGPAEPAGPGRIVTGGGPVEFGVAARVLLLLLTTLLMIG